MKDTTTAPPPKASTSEKDEGGEPKGMAAKGKQLQVRLSEEAMEKLALHAASGRWSADSLIEELIRSGLHKAFAAVKYRGQEIAEEGRYRSFDHTGSQKGVVLRTSLGEYRIQPRLCNTEFQRWQAIYTNRGARDFERKAAEMCLFLLGQQLQEIREEGFTHVIYPEDFLVEQFV